MSRPTLILTSEQFLCTSNRTDFISLIAYTVKHYHGHKHEEETSPLRKRIVVYKWEYIHVHACVHTHGNTGSTEYLEEESNKYLWKWEGRIVHIWLRKPGKPLN